MERSCIVGMESLCHYVELYVGFPDWLTRINTDSYFSKVGLSVCGGMNIYIAYASNQKPNKV